MSLRRGIGKLREEELEIDLSYLLQLGKIRAFRKSKWHGELDRQGVDTIVTRLDGTDIRVNVTTTNLRTVERHKETNRKLERSAILIWPLDLYRKRELRAADLLKTIEEFRPTA